MTYRERREARADRLREWAGGRAAKSDAAHEAVRELADMIPFGQPILVGHHSEGRHRRDVARIENGIRASIDHGRMAERHASRADTIEAQLARSIYSDDVDAVERLEERIAELEADRERMKEANASYRKQHRAELRGMTAYERSQAVPYPSYALQNLTGNIGRQRKRLEQLKRDAATKEAGGRGIGRPMLSRYGGTCPDCGQPFERGASIVYYRATREALCAPCGEVV